MAIQQQLGGAGAEVLPVQTGARTELCHGVHEFVHEGEVGVALQAGLAQARVERVVEQAVAVGAHIQHHRQHPLGVQPGAEGVHGELALADVDAAHALIADAQNPLRIGDQHQIDAALDVGLQHPVQSAPLRGADEQAFDRRAIGAAEALDRLAHGGRVHHRQYGLQVGGQEAMKQHQVAAPQVVHKTELLQGATEADEVLPAALHLQVQSFHLFGQQTLQPQCLAFLVAEGCALVEGRIAQQLQPPQVCEPRPTRPCRGDWIEHHGRLGWRSLH